MGDQERFDGILLNMAQQLGSVDEIMDTFFGFLNRKTDFYTGSTDEKVAQDMVLKYFKKHWKFGQKKRDEIAEKNRLADEERKRKAEERKKKDEEEYRKRQEELASKKGEQQGMQIEEVTEEEAEKIKAEKQAKKDESTSSASSSAKKSEEKKEKDKKEKADDEEEDDKEPPPAGGGGVTDKYTWTQTLTSLEVYVPVRPGLKAKQIVCDIGNDTLKCGVKGEPLILNGKMGGKVRPDDCMWTLIDNKMIQISLEKFQDENWWSCVMKGDPEINCKKIVPDSSKLSDLDGESRMMVEKMMYDQRQKHLGKPTSEQEKQHALLEKFKAAHPEMDFSKTKINYGGGAPGSSMSLG